MMTVASLLAKQMDSAWELVLRAMEDVDDEMLHWKPAPGCWRLRLVDGLWKLDYHVPKPIPPGPKTIGWLAGHLATVKEIHYNYCFESAKK
ncbi:MAG: DinB family protein, partial [Candidatus Zixiibacteriota bacterium]